MKKLSRAIVSSFHCYTPFGRKFYQPIEDFFIANLTKYKDEFDRFYILDSQWGFEPLPDWITVIKTNPSIRYYDAYKQVLPDIQEDLVLFLDNDMVIYKSRIIFEAFEWLKTYDVVSIYDTIGEKHFNRLGGQSKFCPYFFCTRKDTIMKFLDCDWGSKMPKYETFGNLTDKMLQMGLNPKEMEEDKSNFLFEEDLYKIFQNNTYSMGKSLGYYHVRAGSTPAYLLSHRERGDRQYWDYIKNQPKSEYLRQFAWYWIMGGSVYMDKKLLEELGVEYDKWLVYVEQFRIFHGL